MFKITKRYDTLENCNILINTKILICENIGLKSTKGCSEGIIYIKCSGNFLKNFEGIPKSLTLLI